MRTTPLGPRGAHSRGGDAAHLEAMPSPADGRPNPNAKIALTRLRSEIDQRVKGPPSPDSLSFLISAVRSIGGIKGGANLKARIECLYHCVWPLVQGGSNAAAMSALRQLDQLKGRNVDPYWARKIEMLFGLVNAELGDIAEAVSRYSVALRLAREADDVVGEISVLVNLGSALNYGGLFKEAISCLLAGINLSRTEIAVQEAIESGLGGTDLECVGLTNLAQSYHYVEDNDRAFEAISRCLRLSPEPRDSFACTARVTREFTFVRIALDLGLMKQAREHTSLCTAIARRASQRGAAGAAICEGLCEVYDGNVEKGLETLERVLDETKDSASIRLDALLALGNAAGQINEPALALAYFERVFQQICSARESGVRALLSSANLSIAGGLATEGDDLRKFRLAHASLRAKAAERRSDDFRTETLERLAITADIRDEESGGHGSRVGQLAALFAKELGWPKDQCHALDLAGRLHDIGKIGLPDRILLKSESLREAERSFVAAHTKIGAEILGDSRSEPLKMAREVACFHHERWDGRGYPFALAGERIPMSARIVSLADVFDALTHGRPYSPAWPFDRAVAEIRSRIGREFDPDLGPRFVDFITRLRARHPNLDDIAGSSNQSSTFTEARQRIQRLLRSERPAAGDPD